MDYDQITDDDLRILYTVTRERYMTIITRPPALYINTKEFKEVSKELRHIEHEIERRKAQSNS